MVEVIKSVGRQNVSGIKKNIDYVKNEVICFDDNDVLLDNSGGYVSDNLVGLSSTLKYEIDEKLIGANVESSEFLFCLTSDILNKE